MDIELRLLRHATALVSEGSFAKAARVLHLSQPALSRSIQELERRVGSPLFERNRSGITPTEVGRLFLRHAALVLSTASDMSREIDLVKGLHADELIIGVGIYPARLYMNFALPRLLKPGSTARIRVVQDHATGILTRLRRREIDVAVADASYVGPHTDMKLMDLTAHQGLLIARSGHPLVAMQNIQLEDVMSYPFVSTLAAHTRLAALSQAHPDPRQKDIHLLARWIPTLAVEDVSLMKEIVAGTDAVTLLSATLVQEEVASGSLVMLPVPLPWLRITFSILHLAHRTLPPLGEAFVRHVIDANAHVQAEEGRLLRAWSDPSFRM